MSLSIWCSVFTCVSSLVLVHLTFFLEHPLLPFSWHVRTTLDFSLWSSLSPVILLLSLSHVRFWFHLSSWLHTSTSSSSSFLLTPHIHRSILISFTSRLCSCLFVVDHFAVIKEKQFPALSTASPQITPTSHCVIAGMLDSYIRMQRGEIKTKKREIMRIDSARHSRARDCSQRRIAVASFGWKFLRRGSRDICMGISYQRLFYTLIIYIECIKYTVRIIDCMYFFSPKRP